MVSLSRIEGLLSLWVASPPSFGVAGVQLVRSSVLPNNFVDLTLPRARQLFPSPSWPTPDLVGLVGVDYAQRPGFADNQSSSSSSSNLVRNTWPSIQYFLRHAAGESPVCEGGV